MALRSKRNARREDMIRMLEPFEPVIIASDTNPPSKLAKALSAIFRCRLSFPARPATQADKIRITRNCNFKNAHERDALSAALMAYFKIANKMRQVERHYREAASTMELNATKKIVAKGKRMADIL